MRMYKMFPTNEDMEQWIKEQEKKNSNFKVCYRFTAKNLKEELPYININGFEYAVVYTFRKNNMIIKTLNRDAVEAMTGYRPFTTFFEDFSMAEAFGTSAVWDTYERIFEEWKSDYKYLTELVMVLKWKIWEHYMNNDDLARRYNYLWAEADEWACDNLQGDALTYFYKTTDRHGAKMANVKDGWHVVEGYNVYIEGGKIIRGTKKDRNVLNPKFWTKVK